ncbi:heme o synthase [Bacillus badius]|uniref:Protoheme IX farnesyltransferase n=1 Tax=Bacillus badius TaxID=1455 RepID=A0ABR5AWL4_BACBA|nr:heme o synthase [Bacillus badius]KIL74244.1 Heme O synthase, protoheme IX farnesyltransferase COX10-CtaB [Bacillus badius]KIL79123.1 Heme O synthase, protoheme IX farnesyltransferase COX10-CtaB [Bacillus badius]KZR57946.1 protoheme IX farnesyltransferase [Bacillus badius]MED4718756.1 heme o synthase [Bacillus badius]
MRSDAKINRSVQEASLAMPKQHLSNVLAETIKTGIIKSNLIAVLAGLALALYINDISPVEKLPEILLTLIGAALVIGSAGTFNNLYDRDIDSIMERTKKRPTVTGAIQPKPALVLGISMALTGLIILALASPLAAFFGFCGLFLYVVPYTMWTKRHTIYNTEIGSISGAMPPLIGWAAITSDLMHLELLGLFIIMVLWQMPHFYAIAIRKYDEYKAANVPMLPVVKGFKRTYLQTNVYLTALIAGSLLFIPLNIGITIVAFLLSSAWLALSIIGYKKMSPNKWATTMFIFSLNHLTILFVVIIAYCLIGTLFI